MNLSDTRNVEKKIQELKNNITSISEERWRASLSKDNAAELKARVKASEKTLENCDEIARYLNNFSPPLSGEIKYREKIARSALQEIRSTTNPKEFHKWIKNELIPPTKMAERLAHLAATSLRKGQGEDLPFHKWSRKP